MENRKFGEHSKQRDQEAKILKDNAVESDDEEEGGIRVGDIYIPPPTKPYCSTESKGPRLIITRIENEDFKSYAGKITLGPFHHCFTAIIGPNGSGKSNVIDAMLFVFGYRAQKIRCKKLSVLLHNSAKFPNRPSCSVSIFFKQIIDKPNGEIEEIPNSEIVITRSAFKDNSSYYSLNGRRVQFKEISRLLKQHGIDLDHNRFLILQGEVESIAMMKPKGLTENECGMLEYLEDIIGTTRYKEPLIKINAKVEILTEERTEKHNRCKLAEREMKDLEQPYNDAIEYLQLENTLTRTKNLRIQKCLSEKNKILNELNLERGEIEKELEEHNKNFEEIFKQKREKEAIIQDELNQLQKLQEEKQMIQQKIQEASKKYTETQSTMTETNNRRKKNMEQVQKLERQLEDIKKLPKKNESEIEDCQKKIEDLNKEKENLEKKLQENYIELEKQTKPLIEQREKLETNLIDLKNNCDEAKAALSLVESEINILKHDETIENRKYYSLKTSYEEMTKDLQEKKNALEECKRSIPELKRNIADRIKKMEANKQEEHELYNKVMTLKSEIAEKKSSLQTIRSNNKVLDSLMREKAAGRIPGILGRLGDLGAIDEQYDVAISTCCGRLDNIVVDTVNTAQACIEHLKRYDIGRASLIALEKVQHLERYYQSKQTFPENVPRLFDLVRVEDERVRPAFYFALRNTLVARDLEQGTRIAYGAQRYRVVTLRGDVIETSGTMSGGGRTQLRGKMGRKVATKTRVSLDGSGISQKNLDELQINAEKMQNRINYLQEEQSRLKREITQMKIEIQRKEGELNKMEITVKSLSEHLPRLESQLKEQKIKCDRTIADPKKVEQLEKDIEEKKKIYEKSEKAASEISKKITALSTKISNIQGDKIKSVQEKIDNIIKQVKKLNAHVAKLMVEITTSQRNFEKTEKQISDLKAEIKNAQDMLLKLKDERQKYDEEGVEWAEKEKEIIVEIEKIEKSTESIKKEIQSFQMEEGKLNLKKVEIEEKLRTVAEKINDVKVQIPHWQNKLKPLKLNEIPNEPPPEELKIYSEEELNGYDLQDLEYQTVLQEEKVKSSKPNLSVIQEYLNKRESYLERVQTLEDITNKRNEMRQLYDDVRKKRHMEFMQGFHIITKKLKQMYQMITQGGDAELELVDSMDPFSEGVLFSVRPPKKTWKNISNLSGGEKTLSSLALVFALHYYKPSPLYFMDEIDAALDFKNISIVAHYIKERTKNAQFIIISLRSNMFELADYVVGIYKVDDCTLSLTIKNCPPRSEDDTGNKENIQLNTPNPETSVLQSRMSCESKNDEEMNSSGNCAQKSIDVENKSQESISPDNDVSMVQITEPMDEQ